MFLKMRSLDESIIDALVPHTTQHTRIYTYAGKEPLAVYQPISMLGHGRVVFRSAFENMEKR